jgi:ABC-2 type transport system ATP-binding protein
MSNNSNANEAIVVQDLHKRYGHIHALQGVTLHVKRGEIFGLLGANGAGKSTLIKTLVGSTRPSAGSTTVLGLDPTREAALLRRQVGYMPQQAALYEDLTPFDNVRFFAQAHNLARVNEHIHAVLAFTDLLARQHDPIHGFSGGMKQRVSLACALVHQPPVLLLDEPSAGIDPKLRESFWRHFRTLAAQGVTILVSTHQMDEALHCDRVAIMRAGLILACDTPPELLWRGQTAVKVWCGDEVDQVMVTDYPANLPRLLQRYQLAPAVTRIEIQQSTLEDIVLDLISEQDQKSNEHSQSTAVI